ncbi:ribosomal protein S18-alanine N-acetyltransferase [Desulfocurvus sp. DL9XJH121]
MSRSNSEISGAGALAFVRLGLDDLPALVALERRCFATPWEEKQFRLGLEGEVFKVFGLKDGDELAAYCSFYHVADSMEILNIAVRPERRQGGLGTRLLGLVLDICRRLGVASASLEVRETNTAARILYENFGFTPCGLRKGYYPDNGEDAVVMRLDLDKPGLP